MKNIILINELFGKLKNLVETTADYIWVMEDEIKKMIDSNKTVAKNFFYKEKKEKEEELNSCKKIISDAMEDIGDLLYQIKRRQVFLNVVTKNQLQFFWANVLLEAEMLINRLLPQTLKSVQMVVV